YLGPPTQRGESAMGRLNGKTALVTGASRGIGRAIAIELAREGAKVALNYQSNDEKAKEVAYDISKFGGSCVLAKANLADPKEARAMGRRVPHPITPLDCPCKHAGINRDSPLTQLT